MFTNHLTDDQLYQRIIDKEALSAESMHHLNACSYCLSRSNSVLHFIQEIKIARRSQPSTQALQRYTALFRYVEQNSQPSVVAEIWNALRATLLLDSREEAWAGTRSANVASYRLLYTTERADIELLVEPSNRGRRLEGEILTLDQDDQMTPALLQLHNITANTVLHETECNELGRFQFEEVQPDQYQLLITPLHGATIQVDSLSIT